MTSPLRGLMTNDRNHGLPSLLAGSAVIHGAGEVILSSSSQNSASNSSISSGSSRAAVTHSTMAGKAMMRSQ